MAKTRQIGFRLPESEYQKIAAVHAKAKERTLGYAPLGDVIREAIGLIPLKVITQAERDFLSGRLATLEGQDACGPYVNSPGPVPGRDVIKRLSKNPKHGVGH